MSDTDAWRTPGELFYRRTFVVSATPERAFEEWTQARGGWWPHDHRRGKLPVLGIGFEPRVGGDWYERSIDGTRLRRGEVLAWEPPRRVVQGWPLLFGDEDAAEIGITEIELRFTPHGRDNTRVELEHRNMDRTTRLDDVKRLMFSPYGWDLVVHAFSAFLASEPWLPPHPWWLDAVGAEAGAAT
jgi:uncharacterized protein YndB with AHSA1/START domain